MGEGDVFCVLFCYFVFCFVLFCFVPPQLRRKLLHSPKEKKKTKKRGKDEREGREGRMREKERNLREAKKIPHFWVVFLLKKRKNENRKTRERERRKNLDRGRNNI